MEKAVVSGLNGKSGREVSALGPPDAALYLTPPQLAAILQVSTKTVTRWTKTLPGLPVIYLGAGIVRYPRERVLRWFREREGRPVAVARQSRKPVLSAVQTPAPSAVSVNGSAPCAALCAEDIAKAVSQSVRPMSAPSQTVAERTHRHQLDAPVEEARS